MYKDTDLAWSAGFIDGEGCLTIGYSITSRGGDKWVSLLDVTNTKKAGLDKLAALFGGSVRLKGDYVEGWNPSYVWRITGARLQEVVRNILPFLVLKREQAEILIEFGNLPSACRGPHRISEEAAKSRRDLRNRIQFLNKRGS